MAANGSTQTNSTKREKPSERCCFVCKRSILLFKYIKLATVRQSSSPQKKDIIRQLESILKCNERTRQEWRFICEPCRVTANQIYQNQTDEVVRDQFIARYNAAGVIQHVQSDKNKGNANRKPGRRTISCQKELQPTSPQASSKIRKETTSARCIKLTPDVPKIAVNLQETKASSLPFNHTNINENTTRVEDTPAYAVQENQNEKPQNSVADVAGHTTSGNASVSGDIHVEDPENVEVPTLQDTKTSSLSSNYTDMNENTMTVEVKPADAVQKHRTEIPRNSVADEVGKTASENASVSKDVNVQEENDEITSNHSVMPSGDQTEAQIRMEDDQNNNINSNDQNDSNIPESVHTATNGVISPIETTNNFQAAGSSTMNGTKASIFHDPGEADRDIPSADNTYIMQPLVKVEDGTYLSLEEIKEMRLMMDIKAAAFREESRTQRGKVSEKHLQAIMDQHKKQKEECERLRNLEKLRMKETLKEKLESRRRSKAATPLVTIQIPKDEDKNIDEEQADTPEGKRIQLHSTAPTEEDCRQLTDTHEREKNELQQKIDLQKGRQQKDLMAKLAARKNKRGKKEMLGSDLQEQEANGEQYSSTQNHVEPAAEPDKTRSEHVLNDFELGSQNPCQAEMDMMEKQLNRVKDMVLADLWAKLRDRRDQEHLQTIPEESVLSEDDVKQLEECLYEKETAFNDDLNSRKEQLSEREYQRVINTHTKEMEDLQGLLDREKRRMKKTLEDKLAARKERQAAKVNEEKSRVKAIEQEIEIKIASLNQEADDLRPHLSDDEYEQLLSQHRIELGELKGRLRLAMKEERQAGGDMIGVEDNQTAAIVQRIIDSRHVEDPDLCPNTEEEYDILAVQIKDYDSAVMAKLGTQLQINQISETDYCHLMEEHENRMKICYDEIDKYQLQLWELPELSDQEESTTDTSSEEDIPGPVPASATTQRWTTPIQQAITARIPLEEEYPIRRKKHLDSTIFKDLDAHAIKLAQQGSLVMQPSFSALLNDLTRISTTELQKVRLIFRWITAQNCQYMDIADAIDDTPLGVLKGLYHGKITFATLFMRMCRFVGLQCEVVSGCAKLKHYKPGTQITLEDSIYTHTWNAVRIDGYWHFIDCNWGVSYIPGSVTFDPFRYEYDEHYFLADPDTMINTHFPNNPAWQLLTDPIDIQQFNETVPLKPYFFKFGFELLSHFKPVIETRDGELDIELACPSGCILYCTITTVVDNKDISSCGLRFNRYLFIQQVTRNARRCNIRFPEPGHYFVTFYAKQLLLDSEINLESHTEICKYMVKCYAPSLDQEPLPESPVDQWGPVGVEAIGLKPITHKEAVIECPGGEDIEIRFKKAQELHLCKELTHTRLSNEQLDECSKQRESGNEIVFSLNLPEDGQYGFHIYAVQHGIHDLIPLCSYLIINRTMPSEQSSAMVTPDEDCGPSQSFYNFGLATFTHPDPIIHTSDADIQIVFGLSETKVALDQSLTFIANDGRTSDVSECVHCQFESYREGRSVTFTIQLKRPGCYLFRIEGKEKGLPQEVPNTLLYKYIIHKEQ